MNKYDLNSKLDKNSTHKNYSIYIHRYYCVSHIQETLTNQHEKDWKPKRKVNKTWNTRVRKWIPSMR